MFSKVTTQRIKCLSPKQVTNPHIHYVHIKPSNILSFIISGAIYYPSPCRPYLNPTREIQELSLISPGHQSQRTSLKFNNTEMPLRAAL